MTMKARAMTAALPILLLGAAGCLLVSGQITIVQDFGDDLATATTNVYELFVDLTQNQDYRDHQEEIKSLEAIGFVVDITNNGNMDAKGEGWLSLEPLGAAVLTPESIRTDARATRILYVSDPISPGVTRSITFEDSQAYIENFDKIEEAIQEGTIYFYGITDIGQSVAWEDLKLIATINFGL